MSTEREALDTIAGLCDDHEQVGAVRVSDLRAVLAAVEPAPRLALTYDEVIRALDWGKRTVPLRSIEDVALVMRLEREAAQMLP